MGFLGPLRSGCGPTPEGVEQEVREQEVGQGLSGRSIGSTSTLSLLGENIAPPPPALLIRLERARHLSLIFPRTPRTPPRPPRRVGQEEIPPRIIAFLADLRGGRLGLAAIPPSAPARPGRSLLPFLCQFHLCETPPIP